MIPWATIVSLIIAEGIPAAVKIIQHWSKGDDPTTVDWDALIALSRSTARSKLEAKLLAAGIPLDSPKAEELLKLLAP
jgi:hypothetical protein